MSDLGSLDHISRRPLPWRTEADLTECGKPIRELAGRVVTRGEVQRRIKQIGQKRAAFSTCMTCADTCDRWARGRQDTDVAAVAREAGAAANAYPPQTVHVLGGSEDRTERESETWRRRQRLESELEAIAALVAAHREEFEGYLAGMGDTVSLDDRRRTKRSAR